MGASGFRLFLVPTTWGDTFQISLAYSAIVLSLENLPTAAVLMMDFLHHSWLSRENLLTASCVFCLEAKFSKALLWRHVG